MIPDEALHVAAEEAALALADAMEAGSRQVLYMQNEPSVPP